MTYPSFYVYMCIINGDILCMGLNVSKSVYIQSVMNVLLSVQGCKYRMLTVTYACLSYFSNHFQKFENKYLIFECLAKCIGDNFG